MFTTTDINDYLGYQNEIPESLFKNWNKYEDRQLRGYLQSSSLFEKLANILFETGFWRRSLDI